MWLKFKQLRYIKKGSSITRFYHSINWKKIHSHNQEIRKCFRTFIRYLVHQDIDRCNISKGSQKFIATNLLIKNGGISNSFQLSSPDASLHIISSTKLSSFLSVPATTAFKMLHLWKQNRKRKPDLIADGGKNGQTHLRQPNCWTLLNYHLRYPQ